MSHGCWTCRDRKIRCDLRLPKCSNCSQAKRRCLGYGFRLAWPRTGSKRRMIVYAPSAINNATARHSRFKDLFLVNVSSNDVRLCYELAGSGSIHEFSQSQLLTVADTWSVDDCVVTPFDVQGLFMSKPVSWDLIDKQETTLLDYYIKLGSHLFNPLQGNILAPFLLKIAITDTSASSKAVLHAILALSCLHLRRDGEASTYKASAISLLSTSVKPGSEAKVAFQNIAASMLLCMFEVYHVSYTSINWALFLCGVKKIILDGLVQHKIHDQECIVLKDWIYFYEVLARFGLLHWVGKPKRKRMCYEEPTSKLIHITADQLPLEDICAIGYSREVFDSISATTDILLSSKVSRGTPFEYQRQINEIERRLRSFKQDTARQDHVLSSERQLKTAAMVQIYLLAALIYLNRTAIHYSGGEIQHRRLVEEALSYLTQVQVWEVPWPFFIVGCEAQTDSQRKEVLRLSLAPQAEGRLDNAKWVQRMVEAYWNQDDLDTEHNLNYVDKMSAVISACPFLPVFA